MKRFYTKTGIELTVIQGQGLGDGIPRGQLQLVTKDYVPQNETEDLMSRDNLSQWETWIADIFGDDQVS